MFAGGRASYDRTPAPKMLGRKTTIEAIDKDRVREYLKRAVEERNLPIDLNLSVKENLDKLQALFYEYDTPIPTVAAILLFGEEPQRIIPQNTLRCARFQGTTKTSFIDMKDFSGTLPQMIDDAERFVRKNTRIAAKIVDFKRQEVTEYPYKAIREAISNAVAHRDYLITGDDIRVSIFDDRIEVQSPGGLPGPLTLENLDKVHFLRNPLIAQLLFNIRYIEKWNTGINNMRRWMREHGLEEPVFENNRAFFQVTFHGPKDKILDLIPEEGVIDLRELGLNDRQIEALRLMVNQGKEMTNKIYREMFNVSQRTALYDMNHLIKKELVRPVGRGRSRSYKAT